MAVAILVSPCTILPRRMPAWKYQMHLFASWARRKTCVCLYLDTYLDKWKTALCTGSTCALTPTYAIGLKAWGWCLPAPKTARNSRCRTTKTHGPRPGCCLA
eukprot:8667552-Alexandrium_andersonii.AAC.1